MIESSTTEPAATSGDGATDAGTGGTQTSYTPPATQADLDRIITERVNRTKAQFKDYNDLKAKAAEFDQQKAAAQTTEQRQAEELTRWQTEAETWRGAAVGNTIKALASADFADADDAVGQLDTSKYLDAGGQIDEDAIRSDLAELLERKPHWRRPDGAATSRTPAPNRSQGTSGTPAAATPQAEFASILSGQLNGRG